MTELFDAGLQPERTALAWRRTGIALAVVSLISLRATVSVLGPPMAPVCLGALGLSCWAVTMSQRRYRRVVQALTGGPDAPLPTGGGTLTLLAVTVFLLGAGSTLAAVVLSRW